ncbi:type IV pilus modification PilV family protein [Horticoccus sp. 23ND18S-11]|uniref:type IV pilus modification PilV family protein n=1 Tax=Horticoccus sp. 23ND18S-11 TaxID=3391832 RepID=UPI0039C94EA4
MRRTCQSVRTASSSSGFSLIEVVVAVAIFAIGMVSVVGLFAPVARSVAASSDAEAAARVAEAVRTRLQSMPYADVLALLKASNSRGHDITDLDARIDYDLTRDPQLLFANRDGSKVGVYGDAIWLNPTTRRNWDGEKFFEVALIRNEAISPKSSTTTATDGTTATTVPDASAPMIAYSARVRWPAFFADTATTAVQVGSNPNATVRFDHSKKQVLFFAGSITR